MRAISPWNESIQASTAQGTEAEEGQTRQSKGWLSTEGGGLYSEAFEHPTSQETREPENAKA